MLRFAVPPRSKLRHPIVKTLLALTIPVSAFLLSQLPPRVALSQTPEPQRWSIGYRTPWGNPPIPIEDIDWDALTHVVQFGALVTPQGYLDLNFLKVLADAPPLIAAAHAKNVKVLLAVVQPYWLGQTGNFQEAATNNRATLVATIMDAVDRLGFDGVDIDWEPFNAGVNGAAMRALAIDLRQKLGTRILTTAATVGAYAYWGSVESYFDRVNVMTYDLTGTWNPFSWHNAALYDNDPRVWSVNLAVYRYTSNGVPASKLGIGLPFFGWRWTGGGITGPRQYRVSSPTLHQLSYQNLASQITPQTYNWDAYAHVPYLSSHATFQAAEQFVTYDDEKSIAAKVEYVKSNNLGGWIIWALDGDYFPSRNPKNPLLTAAKQAMGPKPAPPEPPAETPTEPPIGPIEPPPAQ